MNPTPALALPAARLRGESEFLVSILSDLRSDTARLIYADWLEEHDDPRGRFLRETVTAFRESSPLPHSDPFPRPWRDLTGITLIQALRESGLTEYADTFLRLARPGVAIATARVNDSVLPEGASKFGGLPDLPEPVEWPRRDQGPLRFLGQINLADLGESAACRALPASGLLSLFLLNPDPPTGYPTGEEAVPGNYRVLYSPATERASRRSAPDDLTESAISPSCRLSFREVLDIPWIVEYSVYNESLRGYDYVLWDENLAEMNHGMRLWRQYIHLKDFVNEKERGWSHILLGHTIPGTFGSDPIPGPDWLNLWSLQSDENLGWCWGDGNYTQWHIKKEDLAELRFDRLKIEIG